MHKQNSTSNVLAQFKHCNIHLIGRICLVSTPGCCSRCPHVQTPGADVQRDRGSRGRLCTVADEGLEESTVPPKCNRLYTVPDAGLGRKYSTTKVKQTVYSRLLKPQHLYGIWSGLTPYRLLLDTLSEYPEP